MKQEEKQLLLKDLSARAMYKPFVQLISGAYNEPEICRLTGVDWPDKVYIDTDSDYYNIGNIKPYLRSMSSMTEEEKEEVRLYFRKSIDELKGKSNDEQFILSFCQDAIGLDILNKHHLDYRGLIPMGLALEAPKDMYKS